MKLLIISDTPTINTGFACVVRNLLHHWRRHFQRIDIWGINYDGWPHEYPHRIYPSGKIWYDARNLMRLLNLIQESDYTHVWILQDSFLLAENDFPKYLREVCSRKKIRIITYFPVDAPPEPEWLEIVKVSDAAATFTQYGVKETLDACGKEVRAIPHGVDTEKFYPIDPPSCRGELRNDWFPDNWQNANILINVNRNERRKGMVQSLQVLAALKRDYGAHFRLYLHCQVKNEMEGIDLRKVGSALGLSYGQDWLAPEENLFKRGLAGLEEFQLNQLYNAADTCITTTLGEGWGLSLTEAAAAGMGIVGPANTSLLEISEIVGGRMQLVPCAKTAIVNVNDNSRVRYPVDVDLMARTIAGVPKYPRLPRLPLSPEAKDFLNWNRIAESWLELF